MTGSFFGLQIGKSGIFTQRKAMDVTSHNIANANTEGYSRQRAVIESARPYMITSLVTPVAAQQIGTGSTVAKIEQFRDEYIDAKITEETSTLNWNTTADNLLKQVEAVMNEPGAATLRDQLDKYWSAWETLSTDASNTALRRNLVEETTTLIESFKEIDNQLRYLKGTPGYCAQGSIENQVQDTVTEINNLANLIASLNQQIGRSETNVNVANDLRDQRQLALENLAKLVNVDSFYNEAGDLTVNIGAHTLVQDITVKELSVVVKNGESASSIAGSPIYPELSDNADVATASLQYTAEQRNITLTVAQLAQAHEQYSYLTFHPLTGPLSNFGVTSGSFYVNGREFFLDAENTDMNGLAKMLDEANLNIDAFLNEAGQLELKASHTGKEFEITSSDGTSNLMTVLNLQTNKAAQDARFNFGGQEYYSSKNVVTDAIPGVTLYLKGTGVANLDLHPIVTSGTLKGLLEVRDGAIDNVLDDLNKLAHTLATETNQIHRVGYGLDGVTGRNFFAAFTSVDPNNAFKDYIQSMALSDEVKNNIEKVAAAGGTIEHPTDRLRTYNGDGDGSNAIRIAQLKFESFFNENKSNFNDFYNEMITEVATVSERYQREAEYSNSLMTQLDAKRAELSGVSLDEELANLIKFQHAYNAAAKVITTVDEMLDKIINGMI
ncbi:MAG: flagellar hook-associated protein FlgK [Candidatus Riflebacteria bacterium]